MRAFILRRVELSVRGGAGRCSCVIGSQDSAATLRLQAFLGSKRASLFGYLDLDRDPDVQKLLDTLRVDARGTSRSCSVPGTACLRKPDGRAGRGLPGLERTALTPKEVRDLVICGAGPGGLSAAVYAASEGLDVLVVRSNRTRWTGGERARSRELPRFPDGYLRPGARGPSVHADGEVRAAVNVRRRAAGDRLLAGAPDRDELSERRKVLARAIVVATGVKYRGAARDLAPTSSASGVYYAATPPRGEAVRRQESSIVGGGNRRARPRSCWRRTPRHVHMLVRGPRARRQHVALPHPPHRGQPADHLAHPHRDRGDGRAPSASSAWSWQRKDAAPETRAIGHVFLMTGAFRRTPRGSGKGLP